MEPLDRSTDAGPAGRPARAAGGGPGRVLGLLAAAWAPVAALEILVGAMEPDWHEPWPLRWARTLADHPVRSSLALGLALWALAPRRRGPQAEHDPGQGFRDIL